MDVVGEERMFLEMSPSRNAGSSPGNLVATTVVGQYLLFFVVSIIMRATEVKALAEEDLELVLVPLKGSSHRVAIEVLLSPFPSHKETPLQRE